KDITPEFERDFSRFLREHANCRLPGIGKHMKHLKRVMAIAKEQKLHHNESFRGFRAYKSTKSNKIYLTKEEMERLESLDLSSQPSVEAELDRFLLAYYFVQRFSDVTQLKRENIFIRDGQSFLQYKSVKTGQEAILPTSQKALDILEKYNYRMDFSTNQQANRELKKICALAGINEVVTEGERTLPKSQLVTTHTARRSAATNLYLQGASLTRIIHGRA
ncbi:MAG: tyrosine-type recombinase/integrase, partial [Lewinellaceae bacterium]|nr:tyrosine-type recombinase/integrase [Lewinellaceae bacterium]